MLVWTGLKAGIHLCLGARRAGLGECTWHGLSAIPGAIGLHLGVHQGAVQPSTDACRAPGPAGPRQPGNLSPLVQERVSRALLPSIGMFSIKLPWRTLSRRYEPQEQGLGIFLDARVRGFPSVDSHASGLLGCRSPPRKYKVSGPTNPGSASSSRISIPTPKMHQQRPGNRCRCALRAEPETEV